MSENVFWIVEFSIGEGCLEEFESLMREMIEATSAQASVTHYEWFLSEDRSTCHLHERYASSEALLGHLAHFGTKYAVRMAKLAKPTRLVVYGSPNDTVRKVIAQGKPVFMGPIAGFAR